MDCEHRVIDERAVCRVGISHLGARLIGQVAGVATAVAVLIAALSLFAQSRSRKFGLAQVYIERYWAVDEYLLHNPRPAADSPDAHRYLRLCEDEFDAARQGWIDVAIWRTWHAGIRSQVQELDLDVREFDQVKQCLDQPEHPPTRCNGLGKTGLRRKVWWFFESPLGS